MRLAGICYTLWVLSGVVFRGWSVGEVFFWMWWEVALSGVSTAFLMHRRHRYLKRGGALDRWKTVGGVILSTLIGLAFATLFGLLALQKDGVGYPDFASYVAARQTTLWVLAVLAFAVHLMTAHGSRLARMTRHEIERPLTHRILAVLGAYLAIICAYHWSGSTRWESSPSHQLILGCALLGTKLLLELWQFFKATPPAQVPSRPMPA